MSHEKRELLEIAALDTLNQSLRPEDVQVLTRESAYTCIEKAETSSNWTRKDIMHAAREMNATYVVPISFDPFVRGDNRPLFWFVSVHLCSGNDGRCIEDVASVELEPSGTIKSVAAATRRLLATELVPREGISLNPLQETSEAAWKEKLRKMDAGTRSAPREPEAGAAQGASLPDGQGGDGIPAESSDTDRTSPDRPAEYTEINSIQKIKHVPFIYPQAAKEAGIEGTVLIQVTCTADGIVSYIEWLEGPTVFQMSVYHSVLQWRFAPRPIAFKFQQPINFTLKHHSFGR